jgi:hypothetical protein
MFVCPLLRLTLQDGSMFKARVTHAPYFYLQIRVSPGTSNNNSSSQ